MPYPRLVAVFKTGNVPRFRRVTGKLFKPANEGGGGKTAPAVYVAFRHFTYKLHKTPIRVGMLPPHTNGLYSGKTG
jgi:hypothetical protein